MNLNNTPTRSLLFIFFLTSFIINPLKSQTIRVNDAVDDESSFSPEELIQNVLVSGTCADISNIKSVVNGNPTDLTSKSYGYFKRLEGSTFPFAINFLNILKWVYSILLSEGMSSLMIFSQALKSLFLYSTSSSVKNG